MTPLYASSSTIHGVSAISAVDTQNGYLATRPSVSSVVALSTHRRLMELMTDMAGSSASTKTGTIKIADQCVFLILKVSLISHLVMLIYTRVGINIIP